MNFIQITDTHFRHAPMEINESFPLDRIVDWDGERLRKVLQNAKSQSQKPDVVLITGDLVHESTAEDYRLFKKLLDEELKGIPYFVALGNHDRRAAFKAGFLQEDGEAKPYYAAFVCCGLRIIVLDSCLTDGNITGRLGEEQLAFLEAELKENSPGGTLVLMHHPVELVYGAGYGMTGGHALTLGRDGGALRKLIRKSDVRAVLSGHTHFNSVFHDGGALYATASGSAFGLNPTDQSRMVFQDTASYFTGRIQGDKLLIGQVDMAFSGEVLFELDLKTLAYAAN